MSNRRADSRHSDLDLWGIKAQTKSRITNDSGLVPDLKASGKRSFRFLGPNVMQSPGKQAVRNSRSIRGFPGKCGQIKCGRPRKSPISSMFSPFSSRYLMVEWRWERRLPKPRPAAPVRIFGFPGNPSASGVQLGSRRIISFPNGT